MVNNKVPNNFRMPRIVIGENWPPDVKLAYPKIEEYEKFTNDDGTLNIEGVFAPKNVRSVNIKGHMIITKFGIIQGPYTHQEWLAYSFTLWGHMNDILNEKISPNTLDWRNLYFRHNDDYYAGSFYHFSDNWLVTINSLPDNDDLKHKIYQDVHSGVDIFSSMGEIKPEKARLYRDKKYYYTEINATEICFGR